jgi:hypothetical protein
MCCVLIMCYLNIHISLHGVICHLSLYSYTKISSIEYGHQVVLYCMICSVLNHPFSCNLNRTVNTQTHDNGWHGNHSLRACAPQWTQPNNSGCRGKPKCCPATDPVSHRKALCKQVSLLPTCTHLCHQHRMTVTRGCIDTFCLSWWWAECARNM